MLLQTTAAITSYLALTVPTPQPSQVANSFLPKTAMLAAYQEIESPSVIQDIILESNYFQEMPPGNSVLQELFDEASSWTSLATAGDFVDTTVLGGDAWSVHMAPTNDLACAIHKKTKSSVIFEKSVDSSASPLKP